MTLRGVESWTGYHTLNGDQPSGNGSHPHLIESAGRSPGGYERYAKPVVDAVGALALLVITLPIMAAISLAILVTMGRPVIICQDRVGLGAQVFRMYKFRTMRPDRRADQSHFDGPDRRLSHKTPDDPRLTPLGQFLRSFSLDELPQLWNVVRGEMSLVGPRPELVSIVDRYGLWGHGRHQVKPGLTGLWQVTARGDGLMHEHTHLDLAYVEQISFRTDSRILLLTIPAALGSRRGF